jgi:hypothetical protein
MAERGNDPAAATELGSGWGHRMVDPDSTGEGYHSGRWSGEFPPGSNARTGAIWREQDEARKAAEDAAIREAQIASSRSWHSSSDETAGTYFSNTSSSWDGQINAAGAILALILVAVGVVWLWFALNPSLRNTASDHLLSMPQQRSDGSLPCPLRPTPPPGSRIFQEAHGILSTARPIRRPDGTCPAAPPWHSIREH